MQRITVHLKQDTGNACKRKGYGVALPSFKYDASGQAGSAVQCCKRCLKIAGLKQQADPFN